MDNNNFHLKEETEKLLGREKVVSEVEAFWAFTSYLVFFLPLLSKHKTSDFVRFHMRQGFALFLFFIVVYSLGLVLPWSLLKVFLYVIVFLWWCFGVTFVLLGREKPLPLFGWIAEKLF